MDPFFEMYMEPQKAPYQTTVVFIGPSGASITSYWVGAKPKALNSKSKS